MKKVDIVEGKQVDHVYNEYKILSSISHPFIVSFVSIQVNLEGMDQDSKYIYLFLEYIAGGELFLHLRE